MNSIVSVAACIAVLVAILAVSWWARPVLSPPERTDALLGFRGLLSMGVFLHHGIIWYHLTHGLGWSDETRFRQFGESRVALFFMMAAMIFFGQLLDATQRRFDWLRFFVGRFMRLAPVYWLAMALMFAIVAFASLHRIDGAGTGIVLRTWSDILGSAAVWLGFSMLGMPAIDGYLNTPMITAAVTWTLPFEIAFYFVLPVLALALRISMSLPVLIIGLCGALWIFAWAPPAPQIAPFLCGMAAALLVRTPRLSALLRGRAAAAIALAMTSCGAFFFETAYSPLCLLLLTLSLSVVAAGNNLFGLLEMSFARRLGNMSYNVFLLHGIVLYTVFMLVLGVERLAPLGPLSFALLVAAVLPVVLLVSHAIQRWVAAPATRSVPQIVAALRRWRRPVRVDRLAAPSVLPTADR